MRLIPVAALFALLAAPALAQGGATLPPPTPRSDPAPAATPPAPITDPGLGARTGAAIDRAAETTGPAIGRALRWTGEQLQGAGTWTARQGERLTEPEAPAAQPARP